MITAWRDHKIFAISIASLACAAALLWAALANPQPVVDSMLGADWQCHRTMFFLTSCTRIEQAVPTAQISRQRTCPRRV
jgi:hypothetical protein